MALNSGIQTYQILTNDEEVCIPSLSSILLAVHWTDLHNGVNGIFNKVDSYFMSCCSRAHHFSGQGSFTFEHVPCRNTFDPFFSLCGERKKKMTHHQPCQASKTTKCRYHTDVLRDMKLNNYKTADTKHNDFPHFMNKETLVQVIIHI